MPHLLAYVHQEPASTREGQLARRRPSVSQLFSPSFPKLTLGTRKKLSRSLGPSLLRPILHRALLGSGFFAFPLFRTFLLPLILFHRGFFALAVFRALLLPLTLFHRGLLALAIFRALLLLLTFLH